MSGQGNQNDVASQARALMKEMKATAEALTKELGLPEERKFDVLSVIYGGAKAEQARLGASREEIAKSAIYEVTRSPFLSEDTNLETNVDWLENYISALPAVADSNESITFGEAVTRFREERAWSRAQLAQNTSLHPLYLHLLERGLLATEDISLTVVARLSFAFGIGLNDWPVLPDQLQPRVSTEIVGEGRTLVRLGFALITDLVQSLVSQQQPDPTRQSAEQNGEPVTIPPPSRFVFPSVELSGTSYHWTLVNSQLTRTIDGTWIIEGFLRDRHENGAVGGKTLGLQIGEIRRRATTAANDGYVSFEDIPVERLDMLEFFVIDADEG